MSIDRRTLIQLLAIAPAAGAATKAPLYFTAPQYQLLRRLCDLIIPGAIDAGAPEFIDLLTSESMDYQRQLSGGLMWIDTKSGEQHGKIFLECSGAEQTQLLDLIAFRESATKDATLSAGITFFALLRDLTLDGYFTSRPGIDYLGFRGNSALPKFTGCPRP
jgi:gluconate 2-dehydrogenase gamma chain